MNQVILIGRLTREPEMRYSSGGGMAVTKFTLAVDRELSSAKKNEAVSQGKPTADFINVAAFGKLAESCAQYLNKGAQCAVLGRIATGSYMTQTGEKKFTTEVNAVRVEFLGSSQQRQGTANTGGNADIDLFVPVEDESEIPF